MWYASTWCRGSGRRGCRRGPFTWTPETTVLLLQGVRQKSFVSVCHETLNVEVGDGGYLWRMEQFMSDSLMASMHAGLWTPYPKISGLPERKLVPHLNRLKLTYGSDHQGFVECERAFIHAVAHGPPGRVHMSVPGEFFGIPSIAPLDLRQRSRPCSSSGSAEAQVVATKEGTCTEVRHQDCPIQGLLVHAATTMTKDSETTEDRSACESTELSGVKVLSYMPSHMGPGSAAKVCDDATAQTIYSLLP